MAHLMELSLLSSNGFTVFLPAVDEIASEVVEPLQDFPSLIGCPPRGKSLETLHERLGAIARVPFQRITRLMLRARGFFAVRFGGRQKGQRVRFIAVRFVQEKFSCKVALLEVFHVPANGSRMIADVLFDPVREIAVAYLVLHIAANHSLLVEAPSRLTGQVDDLSVAFHEACPRFIQVARRLQFRMRWFQYLRNRCLDGGCVTL